MRQAENKLLFSVWRGDESVGGDGLRWEGRKRRLGRISCAVQMITLAAYPLEPHLAL